MSFHITLLGRGFNSRHLHKKREGPEKGPSLFLWLIKLRELNPTKRVRTALTRERAKVGCATALF